jgi:hypothetical protein
VTGFAVEATDGRIGSVGESNYEVGDSYLVIDTGPWIFGKKVVLQADTVMQIDPQEEKVFVSRTKEEIKNAPETPSRTPPTATNWAATPAVSSAACGSVPAIPPRVSRHSWRDAFMRRAGVQRAAQDAGTVSTRFEAPQLMALVLTIASIWSAQSPEAGSATAADRDSGSLGRLLGGDQVE